MERIGQVDLTATLKALHQELKTQTRDTKNDRHRLLCRTYHYVTASLYKTTALSPQTNQVEGRLHDIIHRVLQELFAILVGADGFAPPRIRILCAALVRELSSGDLPIFFRDSYDGDFGQYDQNKVQYFLPLLSELANSDLLVKNVPNAMRWLTDDASDNLPLKVVYIFFISDKTILNY